MSDIVGTILNVALVVVPAYLGILVGNEIITTVFRNTSLVISAPF